MIKDAPLSWFQTQVPHINAVITSLKLGGTNVVRSELALKKGYIFLKPIDRTQPIDPLFSTTPKAAYVGPGEPPAP